MAPETNRVNIIDIFIIEGYECNCLTMLTSMLTLMSLMLLTVKPINNTINKKRLKEVREWRGVKIARKTLKKVNNILQMSFFQQYSFAPKCFLLSLDLSTFLYKTSGLKSGCQISK